MRPSPLVEITARPLCHTETGDSNNGMLRTSFRNRRIVRQDGNDGIYAASVITLMLVIIKKRSSTIIAHFYLENYYKAGTGGVEC
jgi:hypothetical protein